MAPKWSYPKTNQGPPEELRLGNPGSWEERITPRNAIDIKESPLDCATATVSSRVVATSTLHDASKTQSRRAEQSQEARGAPWLRVRRASRGARHDGWSAHPMLPLRFRLQRHLGMPCAVASQRACQSASDQARRGLARLRRTVQSRGNRLGSCVLPAPRGLVRGHPRARSRGRGAEDRREAHLQAQWSVSIDTHHIDSHR